MKPPLSPTAVLSDWLCVRRGTLQVARIDQFLAEEPNLMHACKDVNMTITTESVTVVDMDNCDVRDDADHYYELSFT